MTDAHEPNEIDGPHEGPIKTPKQLILAVLYAFVVPIFGIILLVMFVTTENRPAAGSDALTPEGDRRAHPAGRHGRGQGRVRPRVAEDRRAGLRRAVHHLPHAGPARRAEVRRRRRLGAAHQDRLRRAAALGARRQGPDAARRAAATSATSRSRRAVVYMANKGGAKFAEPKAPAAPASGAAPTQPRRPQSTRRRAAAPRHAGADTPPPRRPPRRPRPRRQRPARRRRTARALHADLHRLPRRRRRRRAQARRQGGLGAAHRPGHRRA